MEYGVAVSNVFDLLDDDAVQVKESPKEVKQDKAPKKAEPVKAAAPAKENNKGERQTNRPPRDGGNRPPRREPREARVEEEGNGETPSENRGEASRGRGGRGGRGEFRGRGRGGRGRGGRDSDRVSGTGRSGREDVREGKGAHNWGSETEPIPEAVAEAAGVELESVPVDLTEAPVEEVAAEAVAEEEEGPKTQTYDEYLKNKKGSELDEQLQVREVEDNDNSFEVLESEEEDEILGGNVERKQKAAKAKEAKKITVSLDQFTGHAIHVPRESDSGRGRGGRGRGEGRGGRGRGEGRGRGGEGRGRGGNRGAPRGAAQSKELKLDDNTAFPSLASPSAK